MSSTDAVTIPSSAVGTQWPGVGCAVYVRRDDRVLIGKRGSASHFAAGVWCAPGGKLDLRESWEDCAHREVREEAGIEIDSVKFFGLTNDIYPVEDRHFITIDLIADYLSGEPTVMEPGKMERWEWVTWDELKRRPVMLSTQNLLVQGISPFDRTLQVGVKAVITDTQGRYLLFHRRHPRPGEQERLWEIPGGRVRSGETTIDALRRELQEEAGLDLKKIGTCLSIQDILRNPALHVVRLTFDVEIVGRLKSFTTNDEHDEARWFHRTELKDLTLDPYLRTVIGADKVRNVVSA